MEPEPNPLFTTAASFVPSLDMAILRQLRDPAAVCSVQVVPASEEV